MKKLFVCAMALAAFVSCSKDDVAQGPALDSMNKSVSIAIKNSATGTRAQLDGTSAGVTAPGTADTEGGNTLASTNAEELYVLFAINDAVQHILPLSGTSQTNDTHTNGTITSEYAVGATSKDAQNGSFVYTWHNVPYKINKIAVVRIDETRDTEYFTVAEDGTITLTEKSVAAYETLAEDEAENLDRSLDEIVLFDTQDLVDTGRTHEVNGITYHYWRADLTVAPKFARFEINNIQCTDLGVANDDDDDLRTYGFDELDIMSLTWNDGKYQIEVAEGGVIGTMYGKYAPEGTPAYDTNSWDGDGTRTNYVTADGLAPEATQAVWSWNVSPTTTVDGKEVAVWENLDVALKAKAYDYKLAEGDAENGIESGRDLTLEVVGLDGEAGSYNFEVGHIYKLNLQFVEGNVKDQDALCVEVTVSIANWTIVDNLDPVFGTNPPAADDAQ